MRTGNDGPAARERRPHLMDRRVAEGGPLKLTLDQQSQLVPGDIELPERAVDGQVRGVARAGALDRVGVGLERVGAEVTDAGVELLVALAERGHAMRPQRVAWALHDLRGHPPVVLIVVAQPGQVDQRRPAVGLVGPWSGQVLLRYSDLPAVRARRARACARRVAVKPQVPDAGTGEARIVRSEERRVGKECRSRW